VYKTSEKTPDGPFGGEKPSINSERVAEQVNTSAYIFDYSLLGCELERTNPHEAGGGDDDAL